MAIACKAVQGDGLLRRETLPTVFTEGRTGSTHHSSGLPSSAAPILHTGLSGGPWHTYIPSWWAAKLLRGWGKCLGIAKGNV